MSEIISVETIWSNEVFGYERKKFYDEVVQQHYHNKTYDKLVHVIGIFLINESWELIIQKRAWSKNHNPNLLDKTVGGHIQRWDTVDYTVMVETVQELQVPSIILKSDDDFGKRFDLLKEYLHTIALIRHIDTKVFTLPKMIHNEMMPITNKLYLFFGIYGGRVKNIDREVKGMLYYELDDLLDEMKAMPTSFTQDLHILLSYYKRQLKDFIRLMRQ